MAIGSILLQAVTSVGLARMMLVKGPATALMVNLAGDLHHWSEFDSQFDFFMYWLQFLYFGVKMINDSCSIWKYIWSVSEVLELCLTHQS